MRITLPNPGGDTGVTVAATPGATLDSVPAAARRKGGGFSPAAEAEEVRPSTTSPLHIPDRSTSPPVAGSGNGAMDVTGARGMTLSLIHI